MSQLEFTVRSARTLKDGSLSMLVVIPQHLARLAKSKFGESGATGALCMPPPEDHSDSVRVLWDSGFLLRGDVLRAIGSDSAFLSWIRLQPCAVTGRLDSEYHPVEAAHVRRVANGAGVGIKPSYSAIPLTAEMHKLQHQHGESAVAPREWWDKARDHYVKKWAWPILKKKLGHENWKNVSPEMVRHWAEQNGVEEQLPEGYGV